VWGLHVLVRISQFVLQLVDQDLLADDLLIFLLAFLFPHWNRHSLLLTQSTHILSRWSLLLLRHLGRFTGIQSRFMCPVDRWLGNVLSHNGQRWMWMLLSIIQHYKGSQCAWNRWTVRRDLPDHARYMHVGSVPFLVGVDAGVLKIEGEIFASAIRWIELLLLLTLKYMPFSLLRGASAKRSLGNISVKI
jgi:hypothetical protein